jgi:hypothetical protein
MYIDLSKQKICTSSVSSVIFPQSYWCHCSLVGHWSLISRQIMISSILNAIKAICNMQSTMTEEAAEDII